MSLMLSSSIRNASWQVLVSIALPYALVLRAFLTCARAAQSGCCCVWRVLSLNKGTLFCTLSLLSIP